MEVTFEHNDRTLTFDLDITVTANHMDGDGWETPREHVFEYTIDGAFFNDHKGGRVHRPLKDIEHFIENISENDIVDIYNGWN